MRSCWPCARGWARGTAGRASRPSSRPASAMRWCCLKSEGVSRCCSASSSVARPSCSRCSRGPGHRCRHGPSSAPAPSSVTVAPQAYFTLRWALPRYRHSSAVLHALCPRAPVVLGAMAVLGATPGPEGGRGDAAASPFLVPARVDSHCAAPTARALRLGVCKLLSALMLEFPGFPELYDPVVAAMGDSMGWSEPDLRRVLGSAPAWPPPAAAFGAAPPAAATARQPELRAGLRNLGNTCYLNSVVQVSTRSHHHSRARRWLTSPTGLVLGADFPASGA